MESRYSLCLKVNQSFKLDQKESHITEIHFNPSLLFTKKIAKTNKKHTFWKVTFHFSFCGRKTHKWVVQKHECPHSLQLGSTSATKPLKASLMHAKFLFLFWRNYFEVQENFWDSWRLHWLCLLRTVGGSSFGEGVCSEVDWSPVVSCFENHQVTATFFVSHIGCQEVLMF